jgi:hypothetical protein
MNNQECGSLAVQFPIDLHVPYIGQPMMAEGFEVQ